MQSIAEATLYSKNQIVEPREAREALGVPAGDKLLITVCGDVAGHSCIAMDTSFFIYHLESNPVYVDLTGAVFEWLEKPGHPAVMSTRTMTEALGHPYRARDTDLVNRYYGLLSTFPHLD